jgi:hypothetical protein
MGILDFFKSKKRKNYEYLTKVLSISIEIFEVIKRKKKDSDRGIINFDFTNSVKDKLLILSYHKHGVLDIFPEEYRNLIVRVVNLDEFDKEYKQNLENSYHFLESFSTSLNRRLEELKNEL